MTDGKQSKTQCVLVNVSNYYFFVGSESILFDVKILQTTTKKQNYKLVTNVECQLLSLRTRLTGKLSVFDVSMEITQFVQMRSQEAGGVCFLVTHILQQIFL